jgi:PAS domain S-box-containing protein
MLLTLVLIALCTAISLHVQFLIVAHREHRETSSALDATEREFKSIFDNALDGILILDDRGICLEANSAAQTLFGAQYYEIVGHPIGSFHAGGGDFSKTWKRFLSRKYEHGETKLSRKDGLTIFVEYTAKADYLPGRHVAVLRDITRRKETEAALSESEHRFQQMATNIQEIFWMLDVSTKQVMIHCARTRLRIRTCFIPKIMSGSSADLKRQSERGDSMKSSESLEPITQFDGCGSAASPFAVQQAQFTALSALPRT